MTSKGLFIRWLGMIGSIGIIEFTGSAGLAESSSGTSSLENRVLLLEQQKPTVTCVCSFNKQNKKYNPMMFIGGRKESIDLGEEQGTLAQCQQILKTATQCDSAK